ncbi:MAG TPA: translation initiation factor IF-2 associated domain-containing protein, partial [Burkholderiaceae bacterium]
MAVTTVAQFAAELNRPSAALLEQLQSAGVAKKSPDDKLTDTDKERLLEFLRSAHGTSGAERKKITLTRKSTSEIKQADASGKARTIQVEVRKKRVFVKREEAPAAAAIEEPVAPVIDEAEVQRREAEAARQAELMRRQDEDAARRAFLLFAHAARFGQLGLLLTNGLGLRAGLFLAALQVDLFRARSGRLLGTRGRIV